MSEYPKRGWRVAMKEEGTLFLQTAVIIGRNHSWYTVQRKDGTIFKQHGNDWHDTVMGAIISEGLQIANLIGYAKRNSEERCKLESQLVWLFQESLRWGELKGEINVLAEKKG